jgi:Putative Actinobacterial Holin-X, holin superfamily III
MTDQETEPNLTAGITTTDRDPTDKTLAQLLSDLSQELSALMHQELDLAKAEVTAKGKRLGVGAGLLIGAGVVAFLGLAAVVACVIAALSQALAVWLAALLVGVALLTIAGVLGVLGKTDIQRASPPVPEEAVESTKEDVAWLKTQVKSAKP